MSSPSASGRIVCSRCGANNFNTQAACWKCGAGLGAGANMSPASPMAQPPSSQMPSSTPLAHSSLQSPTPLGSVDRAQAPVYGGAVDPSLAVWSGIALALFFPFLAVPVGLVFLMVDDRRRADIGRITLIWGLIASFAQILLTFACLKGPYDTWVRPFVSGGKLPAQAQPNPNDVVPSGDLPPGFK